MSNYQSSFHGIDLKLDIEPSLPAHCEPRDLRNGSAAGCAVERNDEYLCTDGTRGLP